MKQPFQKGKEIYTKITAGVAAAAVVVTGGVLAAKFSKNNDSDDYVIPTDEYVTDIEDNNLYLSEDFSINNPEEVRKRAEAIYEISEKTISVDEIEDMIYLTNGKNEGITFAEGTTDTEKFQYIQSLIINYTDLLNDNIRDDVNALANSKAGEAANVEEDIEPYSYMLIAEENKEAKKIAMEVAKLINEQLGNIENYKVEAYEEITNRFYDLFKKVKELNYEDGLMFTMIADLQQKAGLFDLTDEMSDEIYKNYDEYSNIAGFNAVKVLGIDMGSVTDEAEKEGFGNTVTPNGNRYDSEDANDAMNYVGSGTEEETTKIIDAGGQEIGTTQTIISGGEILGTEEKTEIIGVETTTTITVEQGGEILETYTEIFVEDIPDEIIEGNGEVVEQGGQPVAYYTDADVTTITYSLK